MNGQSKAPIVKKIIHTGKKYIPIAKESKVSEKSNKIQVSALFS